MVYMSTVQKSQFKKYTKFNCNFSNSSHKKKLTDVQHNKTTRNCIATNTGKKYTLKCETNLALLRFSLQLKKKLDNTQQCH